MKKLTATLILAFYGFALCGETLQVTLTQDTFLREKEQALGDLSYKQKTYSFRGLISLEKLKGSQRIKIKWNKVNGKPVSSEFLSQFKTQAKELPRGFKVNMTGDFASLIGKKDLALVDEVSDSGGGDSSQGGLSSSGGDSSSEANKQAGSNGQSGSSRSLGQSGSNGKDGQSGSNGQSSSLGQSSSTPKDKTPQVAVKDSTAKKPAETLTDTTYEPCDSQITSSSFITRKKKVLSYSTGKKVRQGCQTDRTFPLMETFEGCTPRHDFQSLKTIMRKKRYYMADSGSRVDVVNCADSAIIYPHLQAVFDCSPVFDAGEQKAYTTKKTYYVDGTGSINTITDCRMSSTDFKTFTNNDYFVEKSDKDRVDYANLVAYRRIRHYIKVGEQKKVVDAWQDDTATPMPIVREYDKCVYFHDQQAQKSYKQYADVYYKNGQRQVVISCQKDATNYFAHVSDSKYCDPIVNNRKMVMRKSVYFFDQNGQRKTVEDCRVSSQERDLTALEIQKDFEVCRAHLDFSARRAYPKYREFVQIKESKTYISACKQDSNFYDMVNTDQGCSPRFDFNSMQAIVKKRLKYNDGQKNIFVSACLDSRTEYLLKNDDAMCRDRLSDDKTQVVKYQAVVYTDSNGAKKIAQTCQTTNQATPVNPRKLVKKYNCADSYDVPNMNVYKQYKNYLDIGGKEEEVSSCQLDKTQFYPIEREFKDCSNDYNTFSMKATLKNRLFYNTGIEKKYISNCIPSNKIVDLIKSTANCPYALTQKKDKIVTQQEVYYIEPGTNAKKVVRKCEPTDQVATIPDSMIIKKYNECNPHWNRITMKVNKRYTSYIKLDGQRETKIKDCQLNLTQSYPAYWDMGACQATFDYASKKAKERGKAYFKDTTQDVTVSECTETGKEFDIKTSSIECIPLSITVQSPPIVVITSAPYYQDQNNIIKWIPDPDTAECSPTANQKNTHEELCEDDPITFVNESKVAYLRTKWIYLHGANKITVKSCFTSNRSSDSYIHRLCEWQHHDSQGYDSKGYSLSLGRYLYKFSSLSLANLTKTSSIAPNKEYNVKGSMGNCSIANGSKQFHTETQGFIGYYQSDFFNIKSSYGRETSYGWNHEHSVPRGHLYTVWHDWYSHFYLSCGTKFKRAKSFTRIDGHVYSFDVGDYIYTRWGTPFYYKELAKEPTYKIERDSEGALIPSHNHEAAVHGPKQTNRCSTGHLSDFQINRVGDWKYTNDLR